MTPDERRRKLIYNAVDDKDFIGGLDTEAAVDAVMRALSIDFMLADRYTPRTESACSCDGCHDGAYGCTGHVRGCTCDVDWDKVYQKEERE